MQLSLTVSAMLKSVIAPYKCSFIAPLFASLTRKAHNFSSLSLSNHSTCVLRPLSSLQSLGFRFSGQRLVNVSNSKVMMSSASGTTRPSVFRLNSYDCIGFDLDNTLCEYNIALAVGMEYATLADFLVREKGYDSEYLLKPLDEFSIDFLQKGLLVDFVHGNIIKVDENGVIIRASHGTKLMSDEEIQNAYGKDKKWEVLSELCRNLLVGWNGPLSERVRALLDYFYMPASLAFARIVDSLDHKLGKPADIYNIWSDVLAGLHHMYDREHYITGEGGYFKEVTSNPHKYIKACSPEVIEWLKEIKKSKLTFLITGSNCDFASFTAETSLGENWRELFDIVVCYARKPAFFTGCRPFIELNGFKETEPVANGGIELGKMYNQGNWQELFQLFAKVLDKQNPKCVYFGDNLVQDIFTPSKYTKCDTVAIVEELGPESDRKHKESLGSHPSLPFVISKSWGSYFYDDRENVNTFWGSILYNHANICIPSLSVLASHSINSEFSTFESHSGGYFPSGPQIPAIPTKNKIKAV